MFYKMLVATKLCKFFNLFNLMPLSKIINTKITHACTYIFTSTNTKIILYSIILTMTDIVGGNFHFQFNTRVVQKLFFFYHKNSI